jgi:hypothetical protein
LTNAGVKTGMLSELAKLYDNREVFDAMRELRLLVTIDSGDDGIPRVRSSRFVDAGIE